MIALGTYGNWIPDTNRFKLPEPPQWFLKMMWDQDPGLVIIPSRVKPNTYLLGRRRALTNRVPMMKKMHNDLLRQTRGSDGDALAENNLVFVDTISGTFGGAWNPALIQALKDRDLWRIGGEKYADNLDQHDQDVRDKRRRVRADDMAHRTNDAYRSYQARSGQRTRPTIQPAKKSSSSSTAGSGLVITG